MPTERARRREESKKKLAEIISRALFSDTSRFVVYWHKVSVLQVLVNGFSTNIQSNDAYNHVRNSRIVIRMYEFSSTLGLRSIHIRRSNIVFIHFPHPTTCCYNSLFVVVVVIVVVPIVIRGYDFVSVLFIYMHSVVICALFVCGKYYFFLQQRFILPPQPL